MHQPPPAADAAEPAGTASVPVSLLSALAADAAGTVDPLIPLANSSDRLLYFLNPYKTPPQANPYNIIDFCYYYMGEVTMDNYFYSQ